MKSRRPPVDWINWRLYRRCWGVSLAALAVVVATSFQPQTPPPAQLPPSFSGVQGGELAKEARAFDAAYPDRRPGKTGSIDSAQAIRAALRDAGADAQILSRTTLDPASRKATPLTTVEAVLRGRTEEAIIITAPRDNAGGEAGGSSGSTMALVALAEELGATRDRRRTYVFLSTDGSRINSSGLANVAARAESLKIKPFAVITLDRIGAGKPVRIGWAPSGRYSPPVGLAIATMDSIRAEGGQGAPPSAITQILRMTAPMTLFEHGQPLRRGLPAITITGGTERSSSTSARDTDPAGITIGIRSAQRLLGTLDGVDTLQTAGKTSIVSEDRVWRGWAVKLLIAALLIPFQAAVADFVVRHRRQWSLRPAIGSVARALLAALWAISLAWLFAAVGWFPGTESGPANPDRLLDQPILALLTWTILVVAGWLVTRAPDRRNILVSGHDRAVLVVSLPVSAVLVSLMLAVNPYAVLLAIPALNAWLLLASRRIHDRSAAILVWTLGLIGPLVGVVTVAAALDTGWGTPWYLLDAIATRTVPAVLGMIIFAGIALGGLILTGILGRVTRPVLPQVLRGELQPRDIPSELLHTTKTTVRRIRNDRSATRPRVNSR